MTVFRRDHEPDQPTVCWECGAPLDDLADVREPIARLGVWCRKCQEKEAA